MKKKISLLLSFILFSISAMAVPAMPGVHTYRQPDGSVIRLEHHGDEFFSWTTIAGTSQVVALDSRGYWTRTTLSPSLKKAAAQRRSEMNELRSLSDRRTHTDNQMTHGSRHIPVFLVEFSDLGFSIEDPARQFNDLLNQRGYSQNGGTGSVQDYYMDNSKGQFQPIFDVYGPVVLPHNMKYYGEPIKDSKGNIISNDRAASEALRDACKLMDDQVDFTAYDSDNDGYVDMTLFYFAGYNTAEWGSEDTIWPHQGYMGGQNYFDGKRVSRYFCTSELKGNSGTNMCGIGTTCHEFGHSLGLPDFYDIDYENNGQCAALSNFSIMCSGSYNNRGCTPPYFNAEERVFLGWMIESDIQELPQGDVSFGSIKDDVAYMSPTETEGEYFLYECRDGSGWDAYIPQGLVVYHVDKSPQRNVNGLSAYDHWKKWTSYNDINAYGDHPCFYVIPAASPNDLNYSEDQLENWVFPGAKKITEFTPRDWDGLSFVELSGISYSAGTVSLTANYPTGKVLKGKVKDNSGHGISGVYVSLTRLPDPLSVLRPKRLRKSGAPKVLEAMTDQDGCFILDVEEFGADQGRITCSKEGYITKGANVSLTKHINSAEIVMSSVATGPIRNYCYFDPDGVLYIVGFSRESSSQMAAIRIPAEDLPEKGGTLTSISFRAYWQAKAYYLIVDSGSDRLYTTPIQLSSNYEKHDLTGLDLKVPGGKDLYVGVGFDQARGIPSGYEGLLFITTLGGDNLYEDFLNLEKSDWTHIQDDISLMLEVELAEKQDDTVNTGPTTFSEIGICAIADPGCGSYAAGDVFDLKLDVPEGVSVSAIVWELDGQAVDSSVTLQAGQHTLKATVSYSDGSEEVFELILSVS